MSIMDRYISTPLGPSSPSLLKTPSPGASLIPNFAPLFFFPNPSIVGLKRMRTAGPSDGSPPGQGLTPSSWRCCPLERHGGGQKLGCNSHRRETVPLPQRQPVASLLGRLFAAHFARFLAPAFSLAHLITPPSPESERCASQPIFSHHGARSSPRQG